MTHPNTDQGVTAEDRKRAWPLARSPYYDSDRDPWMQGRYDHHPAILAMRDHRLSSTAALKAEIASLKQRLESAEGLLSRTRPYVANVVEAHGFLTNRRDLAAIAAFLQEQEKQNG